MCTRQSITYLLDGYFFVLFALTVVAIFETGWASLAAVAKIELVRAPRAAFRNAFKRAKDSSVKVHRNQRREAGTEKGVTQCMLHLRKNLQQPKGVTSVTGGYITPVYATHMGSSFKIYNLSRGALAAAFHAGAGGRP